MRSKVRIICVLPLVFIMSSCYGWYYSEESEYIKFDNSETPDKNYYEEDDDNHTFPEPDDSEVVDNNEEYDDFEEVDNMVSDDVNDIDATEKPDDEIQEGELVGKRIISIDASIYRTCAVDYFGAIYCWGLNAGINSPAKYPGNYLSPVKQIRINGDHWDGVNKISMGRYHACALHDDGFIYCWGKNSKGQLGNESLDDSYTSTLVYKTGDIWGVEIIDISVGSNHSCALDKKGSVYCWGFNLFGQIGDGTFDNRLTPKRVLDGEIEGEMVVKLSSGDNHVCVITEKNSVYCWGQNERGQLGNGTYDDSNIPVKVDTSGVLNGRKIVDMSALSGHVCVIDDLGDIYCWGENNYGQLGIGSSENSPVPVAVDAPGNFQMIAAGWGNTCAVNEDGELYCWGKDMKNVPERIDRGESAELKIVQIDAGQGYACMVTGTGAVFCWGNNSKGELGDGTDIYRETPVRVY